MLLPMLALLTVQAAQGFNTDTTIAVTQGTRLNVENQGGDITVKVWDRNQVRVQASHSRRTHIDVRLVGAVLSLEAEADRGPANMVDYEITVPAWMALNLEGMYATVDVKGSRGSIAVETLDGDITVDGGVESVKLATVQGRIMLTNARGPDRANSVSESIEASGLTGDILAETVSGDIGHRPVGRALDRDANGERRADLRRQIVDGGHYSLLTTAGTSRSRCSKAPTRPCHGGRLR